MLSVVVGVVSGVMAALLLTVVDGPFLLNEFLPIPQFVIYIWIVWMAVLVVPYIVAGIGLLRLKPWVRPLGMIVATFGIINIPLGTALSFYGLWILMSPEADAIFSPRFDR